ncbi:MULTISPECIES: hypothetical protein [Streptomyces]|uniref:hypothetical protein n=1 Tax=Streptomyces TaxID=1883 RepID=UPI000B2E8DE0
MVAGTGPQRRPDLDDPCIGVVVGDNLEFIHRMAEVALLRDLWRARSGAAG